MAVPVITSISPASGLPAVGIVVSITGTDLGAVTAVHFGATAATVFASLSATQAVADAPAGTGVVSVTVTNIDGTSAAGPVFAYSDGLFTVAEARAFDKGQLADGEVFPDAMIVAKEAEVRQWLEQVCGVNFIPTAYIDELHDGDGSSDLMLDWPLPSNPTAAALRYGTTWTALTADELDALQKYETGLIVWDYYVWPRGRQNVRVSYTAGYDDVPLLVKDAALRVCAFDLQPSNLGLAASEYETEGMRASYSIGDGYNGNWHAIPEVRRVIRMYSRDVGGIA